MRVRCRSFSVSLLTAFTLLALPEWSSAQAVTSTITQLPESPLPQNQVAPTDSPSQGATSSSQPSTRPSADDKNAQKTSDDSTATGNSHFGSITGTATDSGRSEERRVG